MKTTYTESELREIIPLLCFSRDTQGTLSAFLRSSRVQENRNIIFSVGGKIILNPDGQIFIEDLSEKDRFHNNKQHRVKLPRSVRLELYNLANQLYLEKEQQEQSQVIRFCEENAPLKSFIAAVKNPNSRIIPCKEVAVKPEYDKKIRDIGDIDKDPDHYYVDLNYRSVTITTSCYEDFKPSENTVYFCDFVLDYNRLFYTRVSWSRKEKLEKQLDNECLGHLDFRVQDYLAELIEQYYDPTKDDAYCAKELIQEVINNRLRWPHMPR